MTWKILDRGGNPVAEQEEELTDREGRQNEFQDDPIVCRSNQVIDIPGEFNGDLSDTSVTIGGMPATMIAENPRGAIFAVPDLGDSVGAVECVVEEAGQRHEIPMVAISLSIEGPREMRLGQSANLRITVNGLGSLSEMDFGRSDDPNSGLVIKYRNDTPANISFPGHSLDSHNVDISQIEDGSYSFEVPFTAEAPGAFVVTAWSWTYSAGSYGNYCSGRQCCVIACGPCTGIWICGDEGTINCAKADRKKETCSRCSQLLCGINHSGGAACGHWFCKCAFGACAC